MVSLLEKFIRFAMRIQLSKLDFGRSTADHYGAFSCTTFPAPHLLDGYVDGHQFPGVCGAVSVHEVPTEVPTRLRSLGLSLRTSDPSPPS